VDLELITFPICPFGQRSLITLIQKELPHRLTYIEPDNRPEWFKQISPLGKVPLLRVNEALSIFESAVINEFIDEISVPRLMPDEPIQRAHNRAWIEFGSACIVQLFQLSVAGDEKSFQSQRKGLNEKLQHLEQVLGDGPYFNAEKLSLVDTTYAPFFLRLELLNELHTIQDLAEFPRLTTWSMALLALASVEAATLPDLKERYLGFLNKRGSWLLQRA